MNELRNLLVMIAVLSLAVFLFLVGAGVVAVLVLAGGCVLLWYRIRYGLWKWKHGAEKTRMHVVDVEYEMVDDGRD